MKKRISVLGIAFVMLFSVVGIMGGCTSVQSEGYFLYTIRTVGNESVVEVFGLTELGRQQQQLIIPTTIGGRRVAWIGAYPTFSLGFGFDFHPGDHSDFVFRSYNLERLFLKRYMHLANNTSSKHMFSSAPNLRGVFIIDAPTAWNESTSYTNNYNLYRVLNNNVWNGEIEEWVCSGVFIYLSYIHYQHISSTHSIIKPANVTYFFNYDTAKNHGVHWIDDVDHGELICFAPPIPQREGYRFVAWYKESEIINRWDFNINRLPERKLDDKGSIVFQSTRLYAKWQAV